MSGKYHYMLYSTVRDQYVKDFNVDQDFNVPSSKNVIVSLIYGDGRKFNARTMRRNVRDVVDNAMNESVFDHIVVVPVWTSSDESTTKYFHNLSIPIMELAALYAAGQSYDAFVMEQDDESDTV